MSWDAFLVATSLQKGVKRIQSFYSHPPIHEADDKAYFMVTGDGRRFRVTVKEVSLQEELQQCS